MPIVRLPDSRLKQPTRTVGRIDDDVRHVIATLLQTMRSQPRCVGLAAPQIGSLLRIAVMDASVHRKAHAQATHGLLILINPAIVEATGSVIQREGCLSIPDFTANVQRASRVRLKAFDQSGGRVEWRLEGFEAIVAQHEVDHLDGLLFLDRVADLKADVFKRKTYL